MLNRPCLGPRPVIHTGHRQSYFVLKETFIRGSSYSALTEMAILVNRGILSMIACLLPDADHGHQRWGQAQEAQAPEPLPAEDGGKRLGGIHHINSYEPHPLHADHLQAYQIVKFIAMIPRAQFRRETVSVCGVSVIAGMRTMS